MASTEIILARSLKEYRVVEVIVVSRYELVFILIHTGGYYPAISSSVRFLPAVNKVFVAFSEKTLKEGFKLALSAHEALEFDMVMLAEDLQKCMYVNSATTAI